MTTSPRGTTSPEPGRDRGRNTQQDQELAATAEAHHEGQLRKSLEKIARAALPDHKQARFDFLLDLRNQTAQIIAEVTCWGFAETSGLDHKLTLFEARLERMIHDPLLAARLADEWAIADSALIHARGTSASCPVCAGSEHTALTMARQILA